ncbi:MAG: hypothetical protein MJZ61_07840 [Bacteroidales bacterium]|nr:hypothetical protein [Bacteroidales bacterium]
MNTIALETLELSIPLSDLDLIKKLSEKLGWIIHLVEKKPASSIDQALDDIEKGNVFHAENVDDLFRQLNED